MDIGLVALAAALLIVAVVVTVHLLRRRRAGSAHIVVGQRKIPLRDSLRIGRELWPDLPEDALREIELEHVEITRAADGSWEVRLYRGEYMFVDGRRSRHNRLHSGAIVTLGQSERARFQFFEK
ncbi:MAG: hypothetical protein NZ693_09685 [Thermoflexales bacterium]|nr:hypothetical protein [Thermoflexales bacterium]